MLLLCYYNVSSIGDTWNLFSDRHFSRGIQLLLPWITAEILAEYYWCKHLNKHLWKHSMLIRNKLEFCSLPESAACSAGEGTSATVVRAVLIHLHPHTDFQLQSTQVSSSACCQRNNAATTNTKTRCLPSFPELSCSLIILLLGLTKGEDNTLKSSPVRQEDNRSTGDASKYHYGNFLWYKQHQEKKTDTISPLFYRQKRQLSVSSDVKLEIHPF